MHTKKLASSIILTSITIFLLWYLWHRRELFSSLQTLNLSDFTGLILLQSLILLLHGFFIKTLVKAFGISLQVREWFGLAATTAISNYITPFSGGALVRAAYLKKRHRLELTRFAVLLAANYLVNFWVISLAGCLTIIFFYAGHARLLLVFFGGSLIAITFLALLPAGHFTGQGIITTRINQLLEGWRIIKNDFRMLSQLALIAAGTNLLHSLSFWLALRALGFSLTFPAALLVSLASTFAVVIKLTPANLGVYESVVALSSNLLGLDPGQGLAAALVIRAAGLLPIFVFGIIFMHILSGEILKGGNGQ